MEIGGGPPSCPPSLRSGTLNTTTRMDNEDNRSHFSKWWVDMRMEDVRNLESNVTVEIIGLHKKELELEEKRLQLEERRLESRLLESLPSKDRLAAMRLLPVQL